jgi:hypothetical protein
MWTWTDGRRAVPITASGYTPICEPRMDGAIAPCKPRGSQRLGIPTGPDGRGQASFDWSAAAAAAAPSTRYRGRSRLWAGHALPTEAGGTAPTLAALGGLADAFDVKPRPLDADRPCLTTRALSVHFTSPEPRSLTGNQGEARASPSRPDQAQQHVGDVPRRIRSEFPS